MYSKLRLLEDIDAPSDEKFIKVYGNYCGPGRAAGPPIDGLDAACRKHDICYHEKGYYDCDCDGVLVKDIEDFLQNGKLTFKQRTFGNMIKAYFKKLTPCGKDSNVNTATA